MKTSIQKTFAAKVGTAVVLAGLAIPAGASAAEIIVYGDAYYSGGSRSYAGDVRNLDREGFNDRISSIRVVSGIWTVCTDSDFRGRCETVSGDISNLDSTGLNDRISSIRLESGQGDYDGGYGRTYDGLVLYADPSFRGRDIRIDYDTPNLEETGFNDRASSVRVLDGIWELCEDAYYRGRCETVSSEATFLGALDNRVSSVRLISRDRDEADDWWRRSRDERWDDWDNNANFRATVYEHVDYRGSSRDFNNAVPNLSSAGFNDRISSIRLEGRWQVCEHINFEGECTIFRFDEANLAQLGWNDRISSLRPIGMVEGRRGALILFEDAQFRGDRQRLRDDEPDLRAVGFNDVASSLRVRNGRWEVCEDTHYRGRCQVVDENYESLGAFRMNDRISSARRLDDHSGYDDGYDRNRGITLYEHVDYQGRTYSSVSSVNNLAGAGFNDILSSFRIDDGVWELCEHSNFEGRCWTYDRDEPNAARAGFNDRISSLRRLDDYDSGYDDGYGGRYDDSYGGGYDDGRYDDGRYDGRLVVYEHTGYAGRSRTYGGDAVNLAQDGWNDQISSFRVEGPGRWEICDDAYYGGRCQTFSSDVANLVDFNWNDRISSLRYLP